MMRSFTLAVAIPFVAGLAACGTETKTAEDTVALGAAELAAVPGLNATVASSIVSGRPHANMVAVNRLLPRTLTDQQRDSVYARIWKPIDLNKATDEEILLIPGVGSRMLHEFKEYRPYTSIEQFRREIGKYVDDTELARLEKYVARP